MVKHNLPGQISSPSSYTPTPPRKSFLFHRLGPCLHVPPFEGRPGEGMTHGLQNCSLGVVLQKVLLAPLSSAVKAGKAVTSRQSCISQGHTLQRRARRTCIRSGWGSCSKHARDALWGNHDHMRCVQNEFTHFRPTSCMKSQNCRNLVSSTILDTDPSSPYLNKLLEPLCHDTTSQ